MGTTGPEGIAPGTEIPRPPESKKARLIGALGSEREVDSGQVGHSGPADYFSGITNQGQTPSVPYLRLPGFWSILNTPHPFEHTTVVFLQTAATAPHFGHATV